MYTKKNLRSELSHSNASNDEKLHAFVSINTTKLKGMVQKDSAMNTEGNFYLKLLVIEIQSSTILCSGKF